MLVGEVGVGEVNNQIADLGDRGIAGDERRIIDGGGENFEMVMRGENVRGE